MPKPDFVSIAAPMRANLKRALAALTEFEQSEFEDTDALGRLAKAAYLISLGSRGLAALSIPDDDFAFAKGANVILNAE